jgi:anti-anti-sigma factor
MSMNSDPALWEMFRAEVDTHMSALNDGLLALEKDPSQSGHFDSLMRAAHSIKGAAKIVGIPTAVEVAHALEDCFVGARDGRLHMSSRLVDVLFEGVDLLGRVAQDDSSAVAEAEAPKVREVTEKIARATRLGTLEEESGGRVTETVPHTHEVKSPTRVFRPERAFDAAWVGAHHREVSAVLRHAPAEVCFDFSNVEAIDSMGLALLSTMERSLSTNAMTDKIKIQLNGVSPQLARLLQATGLDRGCQIVAAEG